MSDRTIRCGYVSAVDYDKGYVQITYPDLDDAVSDWLPMLDVGTEYKMPRVGQQMVTMHLPNGMDSGFALGSYWSEDDKPKATGAGVFRKDMGDGCWMEFNGGTLTIKANKIVLDAGTVEVTGDIEGSGTIKGMKVDGCSGCGG